MAYADIAARIDRVLAEPWGLVTLADVMVGAVCMSVVIFFSEDDLAGRGGLVRTDFYSRPCGELCLGRVAVFAGKKGRNKSLICQNCILWISRWGNLQICVLARPPKAPITR